MAQVDDVHELMMRKGITINHALKELRIRSNGKMYKSYKSKYGDTGQHLVNKKGVIGTSTHGWVKEDGHSVFYKNEITPEQLAERADSIFAKIDKESKKVEMIKIKRVGDQHLMIIDIADLHIGKLAVNSVSNDTYNCDIAYNRAVDALAGLLSKGSNFPVDKILFVMGNDILHIDTPKRTTTSGTPQDTDGMWSEAWDLALELYIRLVETLQHVAPVHCIFNSSNHDYMSGYTLSKAAQSYFSRNKNVTFEVDLRHRKYFTYGVNLIGTTHGDGAKLMDLSKLMSVESKDWSSCRLRYMYTHHFHHYFGKDDIGLTIECMRSLSGTDRWHNDNGYISKKGTQSFFHDKNYGQVCKFIHYS